MILKACVIEKYWDIILIILVSDLVILNTV